MARRYDGQMMLIHRRRVCDELRAIARDLGMSDAELLRTIADEAMPGLRRRASAARREARQREAKQNKADADGTPVPIAA